MLHKGIAFHNVEELEHWEGMPGLLLQRYPKQVREQLGIGYGEVGRRAASVSAGCEIRFVTESNQVRLVLSSPICGVDVLVYNGDYFHSQHEIPVGGTVALHLEQHARFQEVTPEGLRQGRFSPDVWRIMLGAPRGGGQPQLVFHHLETFGHEVRGPLSHEVPGVRWLAYGSSITQGAGATLSHNAYIQQAARRLGFDVLNKGLGGSCFCETSTADYLAGHMGWDLATLELGVNMRGRFTAEEFRERAGYLVGKLVGDHPGKPIFLLNIFPNSAEYLRSQNAPVAVAEPLFREIIRELHQTYASPNLHLIEGDAILTDFAGLTVDLIHPSDYGHGLMGENLANEIRKRLHT